MRYLLLLISLLVVTGCSSAKEPEAAAPATRAPVPTWTATPLPVQTPTATPTPTNLLPTAIPTPLPLPASIPLLIPPNLAEIEEAIGLQFKDSSEGGSPSRFASYLSPRGGIVMVDIDLHLSSYNVGWADVALGDSDALRKFKGWFRRLSESLLDTNAAAEAVILFDTCFDDSLVPAILQIKDAQCLHKINDQTFLGIKYNYELDVLIARIEKQKN